MARLSQQTSHPQPLPVPTGPWSWPDGSFCPLSCLSSTPCGSNPPSSYSPELRPGFNKVSPWSTWASEKNVSQKEGPDSFDSPPRALPCMSKEEKKWPEMTLRKTLLSEEHSSVVFRPLSLHLPPFVPSPGASLSPSICHTGRTQEVELDAVNVLLVSNSGKNNTT